MHGTHNLLVIIIIFIKITTRIMKLCFILSLIYAYIANESVVIFWLNAHH